MLKRLLLCLVPGLLCLGARAAVLPAEKLLPKDTLLVVTAPDGAAAWAVVTNTPFSRMWRDPQLKAFKDKFTDKFTSEVVTPLERNLGVKFSSYEGLAQGQVTFALLPMNDPEHPGEDVAQILIIDSKDQAARLRANLADIRQKWAAAGKPMKTRSIRDIDFTTLILSPGDLSWSKLASKPNGAGRDGEAGDKTSTNKTELTFGQAGSVLMASDSVPAIEKVLSRQAGGLVPALEEEPIFQNDFAARLHGAPFYLWVNIKKIVELVSKASANNESDDSSGGPKPSVILNATGLGGLTSASLTYRSLPEGVTAQIFVGAPEAQRAGLIKAFVVEPKDSNPPAFVPANVVKFWRWRLDIPRTWTQIESVLNGIDPRYGNVFNFIMQNAGKDKDPNYDLKTQLLSNLGNDIIHYEKAARGNTLADMKSPPSIFLIGSPDPEKLAGALKIGLSFMGTTKDREFLGRKIYTLTTAPQGTASPQSLNFAGSGGYVALSSDADILEEYLRSNDNKGKPLSETPGLADAAQKVGGMGTGLFGFDNQNLGTRALVEVLRQQPITLQDILGPSSAMMGALNASDEAGKLREWADFSLLPPYDAISQYFYFSVYSGAFSPDGFSMNFFSPTPPKLR